MGVKRLGALGTLVWDVNRHPSAAGGTALEQWGGAAYSLAALSAACPAEWGVEPIIKIGQDVEARARALLASLPNVQPGAGVRVVPEPNNRVELVYDEDGSRLELQSGGIPPWNWEELAPLLTGLEALYLNFLSGVELRLEALEDLRATFPGPIYADLHSLFLGPATHRPRVPCSLADWERWIACLDVVQLNEQELALLAGARTPDDAFLSEILALGPRLLIMTLGARGVRAVGRWNEESIDAVLPPPEGAVKGDPTGCGDVLGAAICASLLGGLPVEAAVRRAQRLAAAKIRHPRTAGLASHLAAVVAAERG